MEKKKKGKEKEKRKAEENKEKKKKKEREEKRRERQRIFTRMHNQDWTNNENSRSMEKLRHLHPMGLKTLEPIELLLA